VENQKGVVHPHLLLVVAVVIVIWAFVGYLVVTKFLKFSLPGTTPKEPAVELKTEYNNPFKKQSQYVNPYDQFKSQFLNLK